MAEQHIIDPILSTEVLRPVGQYDVHGVETLPEHADFMMARQLAATILAGAKPEKLVNMADDLVLYIYGAEHRLPNGDRLYVEIIQDDGTAFNPKDLEAGYNVHHFSPLAESSHGIEIRRRAFDLTPPRNDRPKHYDDSAETLHHDGILGKRREYGKFMTEIMQADYAEIIKTGLNREERLYWNNSYELINAYDKAVHDWLVAHLELLCEATQVPETAASWYEMLAEY